MSKVIKRDKDALELAILPTASSKSKDPATIPNNNCLGQTVGWSAIVEPNMKYKTAYAQHNVRSDTGNR